jgi:peptidoglycan-associated lipoprotein
MVRRVAVACALALTAAVSANAQTGSTGTSTAQSTTTSQPPSESTARETRPATTTFFGDTGLWFVPTGEVLPNGKWSVSGYRRGTNYIQGYTNVGDFAGTFGVGIKDRAEIFGSFLFDTRIDRDALPLFFADPTQGGIVDRYPGVNQQWTGDNIGDFYVGAKINLLSEYRQNPAAVAVRAMVKLPTGKKDAGVTTGKADFSFDLIASKEAAKVVEVSGYAGYEYRGNPDGYDIPTGAFRWGAGAGFPSRSPVRISTELTGYLPSSDTASITTAGLRGVDQSVPPITSNTENLTRATVALTFQAPKGFFIGGGLSWNVPRQERLPGHTDIDPFADYWDWQVRIGYHPGVRVYVPPPPPPPPPPPAPAPAPHTLTVKAQCDPCTVEVGKSSTVTATADDSTSCSVTYRWAAPSGTLASPAERSTLWTAPNTEGSVPVTVTVTCATDNKTASDTVNIQVTRPPVKNYTFEDVHFDFDRYTLRPEATRVLDEAVAALRDNPTLRVEIEGHTCSIGTAEYNLALGDRRANAVRDYLVSRGVSAERLHTISYGEERPKYDNSREETRRLNRRAALVVNLRQ